MPSVHDVGLVQRRQTAALVNFAVRVPLTPLGHRHAAGNDANRQTRMKRGCGCRRSRLAAAAAAAAAASGFVPFVMPTNHACYDGVTAGDRTESSLVQQGVQPKKDPVYTRALAVPSFPYAVGLDFARRLL